MFKKLTVGWFKQLDWHYLYIWILAIAAAVLVLIWHLASLTGRQLSPAEQMSIASSSDWHLLLSNSLFLPWKVLEWLALHIGHNIWLVRLPSVVLALITLWLSLATLRRWFSRASYVLTAVMFGTSLWFLHFGRLAVPIILYTAAPLAVIQLVIWLSHMRRPRSNFLVAAVIGLVIALTLYTPGLWLLWLALAIWQRKKLALLAKKLPNLALITGSGLLILLLIPLIISFITSPELIKTWLGYTPATSNSFAATLKLFADWPKYLLAYGPKLPAGFWLGHEALVAIFPAVATLLGAFFYIKNWRLRQAKLIGLTLAVALALFVTSGGALLGLASGVIFLLAASGISYGLQLWRRVFPRNPLAYGVAVGLLVILTALTVIYTTRGYYVAWRYNPETAQTFSIKS